VCLEVLEEVSLNTMEFQYVLQFSFGCGCIHNTRTGSTVHTFKFLLLFVICYSVLQVEKLDLITAAMGHALATEGGFCTGSARVIDHQVW
jgi:7-keto-8-aminopelargonate synthetase-like enzyme